MVTAYPVGIRSKGKGVYPMEMLSDFLAWAWARHHNILSWYIRPMFILPFIYFAYKRSEGMLVIIIGWQPACSGSRLDGRPRIAQFSGRRIFPSTDAAKDLPFLTVPSFLGYWRLPSEALLVVGRQ
jgi:hypothetical protein